MASLTKNAATLIVANGLKYAVGFILPIILVRWMSQGEYGTYQQLILISNVGSTVMMLGLPASVYYFYKRSHAPTLIAQTQIILAISGIVTAIGVVVLAPILAQKLHDVRLTKLLPLFAMYVALNIFSELFMNVMISQGRYRLEVMLEFFETVARVSLLASIVAFGYSLRVLILGMILYAAVRLIVRSYWVWTGPDSVRGASWARRFPGTQLSYSLPLAASSGVGVIGNLLDKMVVALSFSPIEYAVYSVGALEVPLDTIFQGSVANVLRASLPALIAEGRHEEVVRIWQESVRKLALVMIPSFVFLSEFAGKLISILFTARYHSSVAVFHIYLLLIPTYMFILNAVPQVFGKTRLNLYVSAQTVACNLVLSVILLRFLGMLGPAVALVISTYLASATYLMITSRLLGRRVTELLPLAALGRTILVSLLSTVPAYAVAVWFRGILSLSLGGMTFLVAFGALAYVFGVIKASDLRHFGVRGKGSAPPKVKQ